MAEQKPVMTEAGARPEEEGEGGAAAGPERRPAKGGRPKKAIAKRKAKHVILSIGCRKRMREKLEMAIGLSLEAMKDFHRSGNPWELNEVLEGQLGVYMHYFKDGGGMCMRRVKEALESAMDSTLEAMTHMHGMEAPGALNAVFARQTELYVKHFG